VGWWSIDDAHTLITVEALGCGSKSAHLGGLGPESLARLLLRELIEEGRA
jgi:hypothetical protein